MRILLKQGVSGYWNGQSYQYPKGSFQIVPDNLGYDLIKAGHAVSANEVERVKADAPFVGRDEVIHAVIHRGRKPRKDV